MALVRRTIAKVKRLREDALRHVGDGRFQDAAPLYEELTRLEPEEGEWPRRAADCYWHLKKPALRLEYSIVAARAYSSAGHLLKAIAMCKVALSIDPNHKETQEELARLHARQPHNQPPPIANRPSVDVPPPAPAKSRDPRHAVLDRAAPTPPPEHQVLKMRARMAAAAALRRLRTERQQQTEIEDPSPPPPEKTTLGRISLKAKHPPQQIVEVPFVAHERPESLAQRRGRPPVAHEDPPVPSLRLDAPASEPHPALDEMRISERLPGRNVPSLAPLSANPQALELDSSSDFHGDPPLSPPWAEPFKPASASPLHSLAPLSLLEPEITPQDTDRELTFEAELELPQEEEHTQERFLRAQAALENTSLFEDVDEETLQHLISELAVVELETGEFLFHQGDMADAMYVIVEGAVLASIVVVPDQAPMEMATLEEGEFFGEIGLLSDQPRQTTARALVPTRLLRFDRATIGRVIDLRPEFLPTLLLFLKVRLVELLTMTSPLFAPFAEEERRSLTERFEFLEVEADTLLLDHGQHPIGMYVLLTGGALLANPQARRGALRHLGPGAIFGEQALLHNRAARIQVRTTKKCFVLCLPSDSFSEIIMTHPTILEYLSTLDDEDTATADRLPMVDHMTFY